MQNKTKNTIERISSIKYKLIIQGIGIGFVTGILVTFFRISLEKADLFRISILDNIGLTGNGIFHGILLLALCFFIVVLCSLRVPLCSGSGIPQVKGELMGQIEQDWFKIIIAKFIGGVCAIGAGLSLGREGPSIQLGAMVGKGFSKFGKKLRTEEKMLMTCGAAAGLSGAFCAPLAGVVFSLEELHKNLSTEILLSTMAASVASDFVSSYIFGLKPVFDLVVCEKLPLNKYWMVGLLGVVLGVFGVFYNLMTKITQNIYDKLPYKAIKIAIPFILIIVLAYFYPIVLGSGHSIVGQVAERDFSIKFLMVLLIIKFIYSIISFGSGAPGGIFLPLLVLGAIFGGGFAQSLQALIGFQDNIIPNFVILGMAGLFSSIVRAPITGVILITEMTGNFDNFLSLALIALVAYVVADVLNGKPIYDQLLERMLSKGLDYGTSDETRKKKVLIESDVHYGALMDGEKVEKMLLPKGCLIVSVKRGAKEIIPNGGTKLLGGDKIVIICSERYLKQVEEKLNNICRQITY